MWHHSCRLTGLSSSRSSVKPAVENRPSVSFIWWGEKTTVMTKWDCKKKPFKSHLVTRGGERIVKKKKNNGSQWAKTKGKEHSRLFTFIRKINVFVPQMTGHYLQRDLNHFWSKCDSCWEKRGGVFPVLLNVNGRQNMQSIKKLKDLKKTFNLPQLIENNIWSLHDISDHTSTPTTSDPPANSRQRYKETT